MKGICLANQTVLLSVDQVVGGHREMVEVERRGVEEVEKGGRSDHDECE